MKKTKFCFFAFLVVFVFALLQAQPAKNFTSNAQAEEETEEDEYYCEEISEDTIWGDEKPTIENDVCVYGDATLTIRGNHHFKGVISLAEENANLVFGSGDQILSGGINAELKNNIFFGKGDYVIENEVFLKNQSKLTINGGSHVRFSKNSNGAGSLTSYQSTIIASGAQDNRIIFENADENFNEYGISISGYNQDNISKFEYVDFIGGGKSWEAIYQASIFDMFINTARAIEGIDGYSTLQVDSAKVQISNSKFSKGNYYAVSNYVFVGDWGELNQSFLRINDSDFVDNINKLAVKSQFRCETQNTFLCYDRVILNNNWYSSSDGPKIDGNEEEEQNIERNGYEVFGKAAVNGWASEPHFPETIPEPEETCTENCNSNVLFLPGIKASKLYREEADGDEDQLWPPNYLGNDVEELFLDEDGKSLQQVYSRDILKTAGPGNIYKTFEENLSDLKTEGKINDYEMFPYDWRKSVEDIAQLGTLYKPNEVKIATNEVKKLAESARNKKVTIIAHSNGGLLAKAIMLELKRLGIEDKIDKIVFVGTPQMGTPKAILSLLYGYDESLIAGTLLDRGEARTFAENMPGAYGLLPSEEYLKRIEDPMIDFYSQNTRYDIFRQAYGESITKDEYGEFFNFLLAKDDHRIKPDEDEVKLENVLNEKLLDEANEMHQRLDAWTPPASVEVIQIAGWGLDTISGLEYKEKDATKCYASNSKIPVCTGVGEFEEFYDPKWTVDGDEVVVSSSALMMEDLSNVKNYWVDLWSYDDLFSVARDHGDIFEVSDLNSFLSDVITNKEKSLPENIKENRPSPEGYDDAKPRLRMSLYSPLDIHLFDDLGNHTGPAIVTEDGQTRTVFEENIPNSYYYQLDDRKYVGFPVGQNVYMKMEGYGNGSYTLEIDEVRLTETGEQTVLQTSFENLPVSPGAEVFLEIPEAGLAGLQDLEADYDGDGKIDYKIETVPDGVATFADIISPEIQIENPKNQIYFNNQKIQIEFFASDNFSKTENLMIEKILDDQKLEQSEIDLKMLRLGQHVLKIKATDEAGNFAQEETQFSISTSIEAIGENVTKYYDEGLISSKQQKNILLVALKVIQERLEFLEMISKNKFLSIRTKKLIQMITVEQIKFHLDFLTGQINKNSKKYDSSIKLLLIEDLQWIKNDVSAKWGK